MSWTYSVTLYGPTESRHEWSLGSRDSTLPVFRGFVETVAWDAAVEHGPSSGGRLAGYSEERLGDEASGATGRVIPLPASMAGSGSRGQVGAIQG